MDNFDFYSEAPGPHYAGYLNTWLADFVDLSEYAGQHIQLRFEYVTNNGVAGPGFLLDDISIPEIGWVDSVEDGDSDWVAEGFLRTQAMVAQNWALATITPGVTPEVQVISVEDGQAAAQLEVPVDGTVILVGAMAPFTQVDAPYSLSLIPDG